MPEIQILLSEEANVMSCLSSKKDYTMEMKRFHSKKDSFTIDRHTFSLVELMVVLVIMGIMPITIQSLPQG